MKIVAKTMAKSIIVNISLVILKLATGILSGYKSIVADAVHSLSDLSTDLVAIIGQKLATKKADADHPYGHGKIEYVTSIIIGTFILLMGIELMKSVFTEKLIVSKSSLIVLIVVAITIISKFVLSRYIYYKGKKINNSILLASAKESTADVFSSIGVFIAIFLSLFQEDIAILKYADKVGTAIISLFILRTAYHILMDNFKAIIGECEKNEEIINEIKKIIMSVPTVMNIDSLTVMKFGSYYQIMLEAAVDDKCSLEEAHEVAHNIEDELLSCRLKIKYVVVHISPYGKH